MARYEHLEIYGAAYQLVLLVEGEVARFSRYDRYGPGQDLRALARAVVGGIVRVNNSRDRRQGFADLQLRLAELQTIVRLCKDVRAFSSFDAYVRVSRLIMDVTLQCQRWHGATPDRAGDD